MLTKNWAQSLLGKNSRVIMLMLAATVMLFTLLGSRELWTQEHRWADIVSGMFYRHDFFHPYLNDVNYYDKPLLSYWLIAGVSYITGHLSMWALRLPAALAGLLSVWSIYRLGLRCKDHQLGMLAGWMLMTTYYFIFWAKTSSADMLNLGGTLCAISWYYDTKDKPGFINYAVFFLLLALTSLCKGLVGAVVPLMVIFPSLLQRAQWRQHLNVALILAVIPAAIVYVLPFWGSGHTASDGYSENGLLLVYRENFLRYFQPFDHKGPFYTYFIYLPIYLLPWTLFLLPTLSTLPARWQKMTEGCKAMSWALLLLFIFFTLSGSRRNYYVLPLVPIAILMLADWFLAESSPGQIAYRVQWAARLVIVFFSLMFFSFNVLQPLYYAQGGLTHFANELHAETAKIKPWSDWHFVMLDPESKIRFYLQLPPSVKNYPLSEDTHTLHKTLDLALALPVLAEQEPGVIFISRKSYAAALKNLLPGYKLITTRPSLGERWLKHENKDAAVAFIPYA